MALCPDKCLQQLAVLRFNWRDFRCLFTYQLMQTLFDPRSLFPEVTLQVVFSVTINLSKSASETGRSVVAMIGSKRICCFPVYHVGSLFPLLAYWFSLTFTWVRRNTAEIKEKMMTKLYTVKEVIPQF